MCKHILNAQVSVRAPCCRRWFDCPQCHKEQCPDHELQRTTTLVLACKKCKKVFRRDMLNFDPETDEFCPFCDNHFVIAAVTPQSRGQLVVELEGSEEMFANRDPRVKRKQHDDVPMGPAASAPAAAPF